MVLSLLLHILLVLPSAGGTRRAGARGPRSHTRAVSARSGFAKVAPGTQAGGPFGADAAAGARQPTPPRDDGRRLRRWGPSLKRRSREGSPLTGSCDRITVSMRCPGNRRQGNRAATRRGAPRDLLQETIPRVELAPGELKPVLTPRRAAVPRLAQPTRPRPRHNGCVRRRSPRPPSSRHRRPHRRHPSLLHPRSSAKRLRRSSRKRSLHPCRPLRRRRRSFLSRNNSRVSCRKRLARSFPKRLRQRSKLRRSSRHPSRHRWPRRARNVRRRVRPTRHRPHNRCPPRPLHPNPHHRNRRVWIPNDRPRVMSSRRDPRLAPRATPAPSRCRVSSLARIRTISSSLARRHRWAWCRRRARRRGSTSKQRKRAGYGDRPIQRAQGNLQSRCSAAGAQRRQAWEGDPEGSAARLPRCVCSVGLLAVPFLVFDTVTDTGCRWR